MSGTDWIWALFALGCVVGTFVLVGCNFIADEITALRRDLAALAVPSPPEETAAPLTPETQNEGEK